MWTSLTEFNETADTQEACRGVIFDLDDVLYPRRQYTLGGYRAVAEYLRTIYGVTLYEALVARSGEGDGVSGIEYALSRCFSGDIEATLMRCQHVFWAHKPRLTLYPDAALALAYLRSRRVRLAAISRNRPHVHTAKVKGLGLDALLDCVFCAGPTEYADTIAGSLMLAELALETPLTRMAYVGVGCQSDFSAAAKAGMITARIERDETDASLITETDASPHLVLPSLAALPGALLDYIAKR